MWSMRRRWDRGWLEPPRAVRSAIPRRCGARASLLHTCPPTPPTDVRACVRACAVRGARRASSRRVYFTLHRCHVELEAEGFASASHTHTAVLAS
jgi:hypothetical protein